MDSDVGVFAQVMAVLIPSFVIVVATVVLAFRLIRSKPRAQPPVVDDRRLDRLEQAVEAIALEMERVGESQRFLTKLMAEQIPAHPDTTDRKLGRVITPH
jgi:hypothetical protein